MTSTLFATTYHALTSEELQELQGWSSDNLAYLRDRAANHGLSTEQLLAEFPADHRSEAFVSAVLPDLEISHIIPQDLRPDLAAEPGNVVLELVAELGGRNQNRLNQVMRPLEVSEVQLQTEIYLDARAAELQGSEPLLLGHAGVADGLDPTATTPHLDPELFSSEIAAATAEASWQEGLSQMGEHVLSFLADMGIPIAAVTARGAAALWPFLRSVDWKRFCTDWRYTMKTLNRAMKAWREGGWKEACCEARRTVSGATTGICCEGNAGFWTERPPAPPPSSSHYNVLHEVPFPHHPPGSRPGAGAGSRLRRNRTLPR
jgi:hypothetical protein